MKEGRARLAICNERPCHSASPLRLGSGAKGLLAHSRFERAFYFNASQEQVFVEDPPLESLSTAMPHTMLYCCEVTGSQTITTRRPKAYGAVHENDVEQNVVLNSSATCLYVSVFITPTTSQALPSETRSEQSQSATRTCDAWYMFSISMSVMDKFETLHTPARSRRLL